MPQRLFISDLHLSPEQPALLSHFLGFLRHRARQASELYILGDLFDHWIGDDDDGPEYRRVIHALRALVDAGTVCLLMPGNRDFLLGRRFARASGCRSLPDPCLIQITGQAVLLMHGDLLCSDDIPYQRFRRLVRNPLIKQLFMLQPLHRRRRMASAYRTRSRTAIANKQPAIMDVSTRTVEYYLRRYQAERLIHGHTHQPADHHLLVDEHARTRMVLADWRALGEAVQAEALVEQEGRWWRESLAA